MARQGSVAERQSGACFLSKTFRNDADEKSKTLFRRVFRAGTVSDGPIRQEKRFHQATQTKTRVNAGFYTGYCTLSHYLKRSIGADGET